MPTTAPCNRPEGLARDPHPCHPKAAGPALPCGPPAPPRSDLFAPAVPLASASVAAAATLSTNPIKTASVDGRVREVAYSGNTLYLVGEFTSATDNGSTVTRN